MARDDPLILIADDDDDIRGVIGASIAALAVRIEEARDGTHAVERCRERLPDLVILDVKMPNMNGVEACQAIKALPGGELVPVIMLTAMDKVEDKVRALDSGADEYLVKPFHHQELQARVRALLRIRELNVCLSETNRQLHAMQEIIMQQERQVVVSQLAGAAAHQLGQPLSAIMLNCYLLEKLPQSDPKYKKSLAAIVADTKRMGALLQRLKAVNASKKADYYGELQILDIDEP